MINKVVTLIIGNAKLLIIKLFHFRKLKYKLYNNVAINSNINIKNNGNITFGKKFILKGNSLLAAHGNGKIEIGNYCGINRGCYIVCHDEIQIGNNVIIGPNVVIVDHDHKFNRGNIDKKQFKSAKITIEDGAWIGANSVILKGTKIGKNSIIAAGSVVNSDVPDEVVFMQKRENTIKNIKS